MLRYIYKYLELLHKFWGDDSQFLSEVGRRIIVDEGVC